MNMKTMLKSVVFFVLIDLLYTVIRNHTTYILLILLYLMLCKVITVI